MSVILGIDPGTTETGWIVWDVDSRSIVPVYEDTKIQWNRPKLMGKDKNEFLLEAFEELVTRGIVDHCAMEFMSSYGKRVGNSVFKTCVWIGRFIQEIQRGTTPGGSPVKVYEIYRKKDVCPWICRDTRAKDKDVRAALINRYGPPGTKAKPGRLYGVSKDIWSALAIAVTLDEKYIRKVKP